MTVRDHPIGARASDMVNNRWGDHRDREPERRGETFTRTCFDCGDEFETDMILRHLCVKWARKYAACGDSVDMPTSIDGVWVEEEE